MEFPQLTPIPFTRETIRRFGGLNRSHRSSEGELEEMINLTGDACPLLSVRGKRGLYASPASPQGLISKEQLCWVDGSDFVIGEQRIPMGLSVEPDMCPKQLISMGAWVIILPDRHYINTADPTDFGPMEAEVTAENVTVSLSRMDGTAYENYHLGSTPPETVTGGELWLDTSGETQVLKQYAADTARWVTVQSTYLRLSAPGIGKPFRKNDAVVLSFPDGVLPGLSGANTVWDRSDDHITVTGILAEAVTVETLTVSRKLPVMDYVVEAGNRLWGCRFGTDENGEFVNRIYASRLGDFRNWNAFQGISTDSYFANVGSDGPFTGAVNFLGEPLFFKENCIHRVWGSYPAEFRVMHNPCRGVEPGSSRSLAIVGEQLYYLSRSGVCAYDGSQPRVISRNLGDRVYTGAVSGSIGSKLYISMESKAGRELLVYDTDQGFWHREEAIAVQCFCTHRGSLYAIDEEKREIVLLSGSGEATEKAVSWMAQTVSLGLEDPDRKYLSRITLRMALEPGGEVHLEAEYDRSGVWEHLAVIRSSDFRSFAIPVRPRRCDTVRLRLRGRGDFKLYSLTKILEGGSDTQW